MKLLLLAAIIALTSCSKSVDKPKPVIPNLYSSASLTINSVTTSKEATGAKFVINVSGNLLNVVNIKLWRSSDLGGVGFAKYTIVPLKAGDNIAYDSKNITYTDYEYILAINEGGNFYYSKTFRLN